jgi:hypothetical protein
MSNDKDKDEYESYFSTYSRYNHDLNKRRRFRFKNWSDFKYLEKLRVKLKLINEDLIEICNVGRATFYTWKRNGRVPTFTLATLREELARFYKREYDEKIRQIYEDFEDENFKEEK